LIGLRGPTISAVAVYHGSQAKVFPQGSTFVIDTKQPSALLFGNNHLDEILATSGQCGRYDVETIASRCFEPLLYGIDNVDGRTDPCGAGETGTEVELTNRRLLSSHPFDELSAHAAVLLTAQRIVGHRVVRRIAHRDHVLAAIVLAEAERIENRDAGVTVLQNVVASWSEHEAQNFGLETTLDYDTRYARSAEFAEVVKGLWDSWG
jgi:hypothetical protein